MVVTGTTVGGLGHATRAGAGQARRPGRAGRAHPAAARPDREGDPRRGHPRRAREARRRPRRPGIGTPRGRPGGRVRADRRAGQQRRRHGHALHRTVDGLELQMATNHFGPFLLTGLLLPQLVASKAATVVAVSSLMHRIARRAPLDDPRHSGGVYAKWPVYGQSKLANLLFTYELDRRARRAELPVKALAAHPGFSGTHLAANGRFGARAAAPPRSSTRRSGRSREPVRMGAWPTLMAATADLPGSTYCGPSGPASCVARPWSWQRQGRTRRVRPAPAVGAQRARDGDPLPLRREWSVGVVRHDLVVETRPPQPVRDGLPPPPFTSRSRTRTIPPSVATYADPSFAIVTAARWLSRSAPRPVRTENDRAPVPDVDRGEVPRVGAPPAVPLGVGVEQPVGERDRRHRARGGLVGGPRQRAVALLSEPGEATRTFTARHPRVGRAAEDGAQRAVVAVVVLDDHSRATETSELSVALSSSPKTACWQTRSPLLVS